MTGLGTRPRQPHSRNQQETAERQPHPSLGQTARGPGPRPNGLGPRTQAPLCLLRQPVRGTRQELPAAVLFLPNLHDADLVQLELPLADKKKGRENPAQKGETM
jgi:hypothetical protein